MSEIGVARTAEEIGRCFDVVKELRPHLDRERFVAQVQRQMQAGYRLIYLEVGGQVAAAAGFRIVEMLAWGKSLYVDDLIAAERFRAQGFGSRLFDWMLAEACRSGCDQYHLDSGVNRFAAHRFYLHKGMDITSHHFAMKLQH